MKLNISTNFYSLYVIVFSLSLFIQKKKIFFRKNFCWIISVRDIDIEIMQKSPISIEFSGFWNSFFCNKNMFKFQI